MVLDEGHKLKNSKTVAFQQVDENYSADFRIITTATPFQNDIYELWSLLYLIAPTQFCSVELFNASFSEIENSGDSVNHNLVIERLHGILRPYVLRRVKRDVSFDIPSKHEVTLKCVPSALQEAILARSLALALPMKQKLTLSRKVSNSPSLFLPDERIPPPYLLSRAPKIALLDRIVRRLALTGHRFLIYSQWTRMMDLIEAHLAWRGLSILRIDGSVPTRVRMERIRRFVATGSSYIGMVLSTRSSAFGLNLQVADTVILFDSDYNPFVELQASSRVHRIGQTHVVVVIRLMMNGTGEEKILHVSRRKFLLGNEIIEGGKFNLKMADAGEVEELTKPIPEILDPSDDDLNSILARAPEDIGVMQFAGEVAREDDEAQFAEIDAAILDTFGGALEIPEGSEDEWEAC
jgi:SNF2 family DNA or RNA helicase